MRRDPDEQVSEVGKRVARGPLAGLGQGLDRRGGAPAAHAAREQPNSQFLRPMATGRMARSTPLLRWLDFATRATGRDCRPRGVGLPVVAGAVMVNLLNLVTPH